MIAADAWSRSLEQRIQVKELAKRRRPVAAWWACPGNRAYRPL